MPRPAALTGQRARVVLRSPGWGREQSANGKRDETYGEEERREGLVPVSTKWCLCDSPRPGSPALSVCTVYKVKVTVAALSYPGDGGLGETAL